MTSAFAGSCAPRHKTHGPRASELNLNRNAGILPAVWAASRRPLRVASIFGELCYDGGQDARRTAGATPALQLRSRFQNPGAKV
jgi:hypothetical protein